MYLYVDSYNQHHRIRPTDFIDPSNRSIIGSLIVRDAMYVNSNFV